MAQAVEIVPFEKLSTLDLAFDHRRILDDYLAWRKTAHQCAKVRKHGSGTDTNEIQRDTCACLTRPSKLTISPPANSGSP